MAAAMLAAGVAALAVGVVVMITADVGIVCKRACPQGVHRTAHGLYADKILRAVAIPQHPLIEGLRRVHAKATDPGGSSRNSLRQCFSANRLASASNEIYQYQYPYT